jgi:parvulin-like peptidyl-prolyl isomerase
MANFSGLPVTTEEIIEFLQRDLQLQEICQEIIAQRIIGQAASEAGISVRPEEVQAELDRIRYEQSFDHPAQLLAWAAQQMTTLSKIEQRIQERLLTQKLARHFFLNEIRDRFSHDRRNFEQIFLYEIIVPYEALAREIYYQIEEEEISFFEAAHVYNIDESRRLVCGFVGKLLRSRLDPELAASLQNAQAGEVVGPIQLAENRFTLLLLDEVLSPELTTGVSDLLMEEMFQEWLRDKLSEYIN